MARPRSTMHRPVSSWPTGTSRDEHARDETERRRRDYEAARERRRKRHDRDEPDDQELVEADEERRSSRDEIPKQRQDSPPAQPGGGSDTRRGTRQPAVLPPSRRARPKSGRAGAAVRTFATNSVEKVSAPFGNVASAAWTIFMGGLSVVLLYILLSRSGVGLITATLHGLSAGFRRFTDPWSPLFASREESSPPPPTTKLTRSQRNYYRSVKRAIRHDPQAAKKLRETTGLKLPPAKEWDQ